MVPDGTNWIFAYLLPPLLGAGIGYLTNAIAIRMLFRPFTEKRIFGIRVPFTPGIIPKYRYQLAENIGTLVSEELLSKEMLEKHVLSSGFYDGVAERIGTFTEGILNRKVGDFLSVIKKNRHHPCVLPEFTGFHQIMNKPMKSLIPFEAGETGRNIFLLLYPKILDAIMDTFRRPDVKERLQDRGRDFIEKVQERMNFFQKFMISAGRYDKTLKKKMPEIIEDLLHRIEDLGKDPKNIEFLSRSLEDGIEDFMENPLSHIEELKGLKFSDILKIEDGSFARSVFITRQLRIDDLIKLDNHQRLRFDRWIVHLGMEQIIKHLDSILQIVDIKQLVVDRINKLGIEDVERILLIIIEKHLTWINIFGAILGSIIGGIQILFRFIG